jgi:predicted DsbA family dithiol-disulfide isomerase
MTTTKETKETSKFSSEFIKNHYGLEESEWKKLLNKKTLNMFNKQVDNDVKDEQQKNLKLYLQVVITQFIAVEKGVTPEQFCTVLREVLSEEHEYHQEQANKNKKILDLLNYTI